MSDLRKAAEQALATWGHTGKDLPEYVILERGQALADALRAALAEPEQSEPVAAIHIGWDYLDNGKMVATYAVPVNEQVAPRLYAAPPRREPLTPEEIWSNDEIMSKSQGKLLILDLVDLVKAIEQAHGITGEKT